MTESKCPRCLHVGPTEVDFGYRWMNCKKRAQSHCRLCRGGAKTRPAPGARQPVKPVPKLIEVYTAPELGQLLIFGGVKPIRKRRRA